MKKDQEFTASVTYHEHRGHYLPKPVMEMLGNPNAIKFIIKNKKVELEAGNWNN